MISRKYNFHVFFSIAIVFAGLSFLRLAHAQGDSIEWSPARWDSALSMISPATKNSTSEKPIRHIVVLGTLGLPRARTEPLAHFLQKKKIPLVLQGMPWRQTKKRLSHQPLTELLRPYIDRNVAVRVDYRYFDAVRDSSLKSLPLLWVESNNLVHLYSRASKTNDYTQWEDIVDAQ